MLRKALLPNKDAHLIYADESLELDWSTRESCQEFLNQVAIKFKKASEYGVSDYNWTNALDECSYDPKMIDFNPWSMFYSRQDLCSALNGMKNIQEANISFDLKTWSKNQILIRNHYVFRNKEDQTLVWRGNIMARLNDKNKISHWIYIMEESMKQEILKFKL